MQMWNKSMKYKFDFEMLANQFFIITDYTQKINDLFYIEDMSIHLE